MSELEAWQPYDPYPEPSHPQSKTRPTDIEPIKVRHPSYHDICNTLLKFWSFDSRDVHHETVRVACAIVANNAWGGYLSTDRDGNDPVMESPDSILRSKSYYFHVAQPNDGEVVDYPVIPNFEHWRFPSTLPPSWREISEFPRNLQPPPESHCRLTQCDYSVENAHLIPAVEREWFDKNSMSDYIHSTAIDKMKDTDNIVRLRSDIHTVFDSKQFAIVPINRRVVAYCLNAKPGSHVGRLYHGVELHGLKNPPQLLFARLAYTVFERLRDFLDARAERKLLIRVGDTWETEACDFEKCQQFSRVTASQGKSKSVSPKKRLRVQEAREMEISDVDWSDEEESTDDEEELRGRKRRRTDEFTAPLPSLSFSSGAGAGASASSLCLSEDQSAATPEKSVLPVQTKDRGGGVDAYINISDPT